ncbi:nucleoid occlusion factor SlmA [SAR86 cluster bacterium]|jgi:TetR/AcrR family transcriptional regulator|nr:nucleoid occlusion factor SlmA [Gammaproteobacteria bacterium]URQ73680.1 nucleoid occlusion factor SlmA [SAR86 cluster bacterium]|tara:strand:- start:2831 stop:3415 length:585 start_codon:yes stop_codon:yes gene_type:complete
MAEDKVSRKTQIMQTLARMLEEKEPVKITTAELARRTEITEAAIYRHFPSKRKIYEEMVIFFESNIFPRIESIRSNHPSEEVPGLIVSLILSFCETNKGFAKILNKQALTAAEAKIDDKISLIFERLNVEIKQSFQSYERETKKKLKINSSSSADLLMSCMEGQIQAFTRSNFKKNSLTDWQAHWNLLKDSIFV